MDTKKRKASAETPPEESVRIFYCLTAPLVEEHWHQAQRVAGVRGRAPAAASPATC